MKKHKSNRSSPTDKKKIRAIIETNKIERYGSVARQHVDVFRRKVLQVAATKKCY